MMSLGQRIKNRRIELKLTQEELAKKSEISKGFLCDLENGKRRVSADRLLNIARVLGKSLDYLLTGDTDGEVESKDIQIPSSLSTLANETGITFKQVLMLLDMHDQILAYRSETRQTNIEDFDWRKLYESVKEFLL